jgi:hypothetical protein
VIVTSRGGAAAAAGSTNQPAEETELADDIHSIFADFEARLWAGLDARFDRLEQSVRRPDLSPDVQARRDSAQVWQMYAALQQRMDRMELRLQEIERKLEPPLPPLPGFQP